MRQLSLLVVMALALMLISGCGADGSFVNPFADSSTPPSSPYYFDEFPDLPIPNEMTETASETVVTTNSSGVKTGIQYFKGRVEAASLINTMRRNMTAQGWTMRSLFRAQQTIMIFEKDNRVCSLYITDGLIYTEMRVFMSQRLEGDTSFTDMSQYTAPGTSSNAGSKTVLTE